MRKSTMHCSGLRTACAAAALSAACGVPLPVLAQLSNAAAAPPPVIELAHVEAYLNDSMLTARVKLALLDAPDVRALDIGVQTYRGVVLLSGFVENERLVRRAAEIATNVEGVKAVRNTLQVKG